MRSACRSAWVPGDAPDHFLVSLATLSLLAEVADERPLVCLVDDAQWLDRASLQTLEFVARRLLAESVALVFGARHSGEGQPLAGLPGLVVEGLGNDDARALLGSVIRWPLDEHVRDRIIAETRGNPLALLELPRGLTPAEMAGGFGLPDVQLLPARIEDSFRRRLQQLPTETQRLLLVAAAEPVGEPTLVWRAAERLGIGVDAADSAESDGLVEFGVGVRFRHPLVRSAVYQAASPKERRNAHRVLSEVTDQYRDPDRRAWHRAQATSGPDEDVASDLERSAARAQARGGLAAGAAFLEQATRLTPNPTRRGQRALAAARAKLQAGAPDAALGLLATAQAGPLDELQRALADLLRAQIAFAVNRGREAPPLLLKAAKRLEPLDVGLTRGTYLEALQAAMFVGRLASGGGLLEVAQAARGAPSSPQPSRAPELLLDGLALLISEGYAVGTPIVRRALSAFRGEDISNEEGLRWLWLACRAAVDLWDDESWYLLSTRHVQLARDAGAMRHPLSTTPRSRGLRRTSEGPVAVGHVEGLVVRDAPVQAVPQDLEPAVPEGPERGVVALAPGPLGVVELPGPCGLLQAAERPLVHRVGEEPVAGEPARHHQLALAGAAGDRGPAGVALQRVRRGELLRMIADLTGHPGGETVTEARKAQVDLAARERLPHVFLSGLLVPSSSWLAEQELAHSLLPRPPLCPDGEELGDPQADGVCFGPHQVAPGGEVLGTEGGVEDRKSTRLNS